MWQFINSSGVAPFGIAIVLMLALGVVEVLSVLLGAGSDWVDGLLPEGLTEIHAEAGIDGSEMGLMGFLSWLYLGKVPMLMWLVVFLTVFGLMGLIMQSIIWQMTGWVLPSLIAVPAVLMASLPLVRVSAKGIFKVMPKDETTAIHSDTLVGRVGMITLGTAQVGQAAEIRVKDGFGQTHYVMGEPDSDEVLTAGTSVLLVSGENSRFKIIKNPSGALVD